MSHMQDTEVQSHPLTHSQFFQNPFFLLSNCHALSSIEKCTFQSLKILGGKIPLCKENQRKSTFSSFWVFLLCVLGFFPLVLFC